MNARMSSGLIVDTHKPYPAPAYSNVRARVRAWARARAASIEIQIQSIRSFLHNLVIFARRHTQVSGNQVASIIRWASR